jgi:O-acetyl-ADP-ribose deacetylase (regulator of RNase III)
MPVTPQVVEGDLLDQQVEAIVNSWNRNLIPWWLLLPSGVAGAIKKRAGIQPFRELARHGVLPLGGAAVTGAGRLPYKAIIHVAGIGLLWTASERSVRASVRNALRLAAERVLGWMRDEMAQLEFPGEVRVVRYRVKSAR